MEQSVAGKKLLIMGGRPAATPDIVRAARGLGVYTIVTDNVAPERSPAKLMADEYWDISTAEVERLAERVRDEGVDGIFTGVHEFNLKRTKELCALCGKPFYASEEQLRLNFDKVFFKESCKQAGIDVPESYAVTPDLGEDELRALRYPLIVKPRDGGGGVGVTICTDEAELRQAVALAVRESPSGQIVAEEYVVGREVTAVYVIKDGVISFVCLRDRYPTKEHERVTSQYDLSLMPSKYMDLFLRQSDPGFRRLLARVGASNGCVFFQGIAAPGRITFFECGYRLNALCDYHNIRDAYGVDYLEMMIRFALTGSMGEGALREIYSDMRGYSGIFNMTARSGVIGRLSGREQVLVLENVLAAEYLKTEGDVIADDAAMTQSVFRAHIRGRDLEELAEVIRAIQSLVRVEDTEGRDMLFCPFDVRRLHEPF